MPKQKEIRRLARKAGISAEEMSKRVFGRMRKLGWKPKKHGSSTKAWKKRTK